MEINITYHRCLHGVATLMGWIGEGFCFLIVNFVKLFDVCVCITDK